MAAAFIGCNFPLKPSEKLAIHHATCVSICISHAAIIRAFLSKHKQQAAQLALPEIIQTSKQATMSVTLPKKLALAQATSVVQQQVYHHQAYTLFMSNF